LQTLSVRQTTQLGSKISVFDYVRFGSAMSIRSYARIGSTISSYSHAHLGCSLSVFGSVTSSSLSVEALAHFSSELSVNGIANLRSALSVRSFARLGSSLSVLGVSRLASCLSVLDFVQMGSTLSLRGFARVGSTLSVYDVAHLGSSLSIRSFMRLGSSLSSAKLLSSTMSLLDSVSLGSSLSLRGFARFGSTMSLVDSCVLGSSLSVRSFTRFGSQVSFNDRINFGKENTYIRYESIPALTSEGVNTQYDTLQFYANSGGTAKRGLAVRGLGGYLHGEWVADQTVSTSDRRLKTSIVPLYKAIEQQGARQGEKAPESVDWVLRQLRPVSYKFKQGPEAKHSRYGFVAQELQQVLPSVVRKLEDNHLAVVYQDLIALLTAAAQMLQEKVAKQELKITRLELELQKINSKMDLLLAAQPGNVPPIAV